MKNSCDTIGNPTRDLPACSAVPQPTAPPRAPLSQQICSKKFNETFGNRINVCHKAICIEGSLPCPRRFSPASHQEGVGSIPAHFLSDL